eukprot:gene38158-8818_t
MLVTSVRLPEERVRVVEVQHTERRVAHEKAGGAQIAHGTTAEKRVPGTDKASVRAAMEAAGVLHPRHDGEPTWLRFQRGRSEGGGEQAGFVSRLYGRVLEKDRALCLPPAAGRSDAGLKQLRLLTDQFPDTCAREDALVRTRKRGYLCMPRARPRLDGSWPLGTVYSAVGRAVALGHPTDEVCYRRAGRPLAEQLAVFTAARVMVAA